MAARDATAPARLVVDIGVMLFLGAVDRVPEHRCAGPVVALGLDGEFEVTTAAGSARARCLRMPAGVPRAVQGFGQRLGITLIDPGLALGDTVDEPQALACAGHLLAHGANPAAWRGYLAAIGCRGPAAELDERVRAAAGLLDTTSDENHPLAEVASRVGLSAPRLARLFSRQMGTPMRAYRNGCRFRRVARAMAGGADLTGAAHAAGFFDSAHFVHAFRRSFGITPGFVFQHGLVVDVMGDDGAIPA